MRYKFSKVLPFLLAVCMAFMMTSIVLAEDEKNSNADKHISENNPANGILIPPITNDLNKTSAKDVTKDPAKVHRVHPNQETGTGDYSIMSIWFQLGAATLAMFCFLVIAGILRRAEIIGKNE